MPRPYRIRPKVHRWDDYEVSARHTFSRDYRLRPVGFRDAGINDRGRQVYRPRRWRVAQLTA
ncbi:hypothetical protein N602_27910 [Mycobacterium avium subsp. hominissuis 10-5606]|nr:hypothetical protein N602_27910 [Mycobacterium avium subsp. hominissuis 10-5606]